MQTTEMKFGRKSLFTLIIDDYPESEYLINKVNIKGDVAGDIQEITFDILETENFSTLKWLEKVPKNVRATLKFYNGSSELVHTKQFAFKIYSYEVTLDWNDPNSIIQYKVIAI